MKIVLRHIQEIVLYDKEDWGKQLINAINTKNTLVNIGSVYENTSVLLGTQL